MQEEKPKEYPMMHKIEGWAKKTWQANSRIVQIYLDLSNENNGINLKKFQDRLKKDKLVNSFNQMTGHGKQSNGKIFDKENGVLFMPDEIYSEVLKYFTFPLSEMPKGNKELKKRIVEIEVFDRDKEVKRWILENANGVCEGCGDGASFKKDNGEPYLEVHHVKTLTDGGPDTVQNAVALCPNCHRRCHYSADKDEFKEDLYNNKRLIKE